MPTVEKLNFRFSEHHINRLTDLSHQTGLTKTDVLRLLLDRAEALIPSCVDKMATQHACVIFLRNGQIAIRQQEAG